MPANKNASYRYRLIDYCLSNPGIKWTMEKLIDFISQRLIEERRSKTGVSKRTLLNDFDVMRRAWPEGFGANIIRKNKEVRYGDPNFSIRNSPLIEKDVKDLKEALKLLEQFTEIPVFEELQQIVVKLENRLFKTEQQERSIIHIEKNSLVKGLAWIRPLYKIIAAEKPIRLHYHPFHEPPFFKIVHPYLLKEYNNRWFLLALTEEERRIWTFALDRILDFKPANVPPFPAQTFKPERYFENIVGVTIYKEAQLEDVQIKVSKNRAPYLKTKPLHPSQQVEELPDGAAIFSYRLLPNKELISELLSYGADLEVLQPVSLRAEIKEILKKAWGQY